MQYKYKTKPILILCATVGILTFSSRDAQAQSILGTSLDSIFDSVVQMLELININIPGLDFWANEVLEDPCADSPVIFIAAPEPGYCLQRTPVGSISETIYDSSQEGALGIPNPNAVRTKIDQSMNGQTGLSLGDAFDLNAVNLAITYANRAEGAVARQFIESTLGSEAQENTQKELETTTELLKSVEETTKEAENADSTQDVVKLMTANQYAMQQSLSAIQAHQIKQEQLIAVQLGMLANVAASLDKFEKYHRARSANEITSLLKRSSQTTLF